jgi:ATP/maltotriose-dependent transcriptional regulator MalT
MTIIANEFVKDLEKIWDSLKWERKFEYSTPSANITHVWHAYSQEEVAEAEEILANLAEEEELEGRYIIRSAHLGSWSSGEVIVICESELD